MASDLLQRLTACALSQPTGVLTKVGAGGTTFERLQNSA
jgi:hypothetical protein